MYSMTCVTLLLLDTLKSLMSCPNDPLKLDNVSNFYIGFLYFLHIINLWKIKCLYSLNLMSSLDILMVLYIVLFYSLVNPNRNLHYVQIYCFNCIYLFNGRLFIVFSFDKTILEIAYEGYVLFLI